MLNKLKIGTLLLLTLTACSPNSVHSVTSNPQPASAPVQQSATQATFQQTLANLEQQYQARIGVYVWDTETGHSLSYRADERFAYQRTLMVQLADTKNKELAHVIQLLKHKKITPLAFQQGAYFLSWFDNSRANIRIFLRLKRGGI